MTPYKRNGVSGRSDAFEGGTVRTCSRPTIESACARNRSRVDKKIVNSRRLLPGLDIRPCVFTNTGNCFEYGPQRPSLSYTCEQAELHLSDSTALIGFQHFEKLFVAKVLLPIVAEHSTMLIWSGNNCPSWWICRHKSRAWMLSSGLNCGRAQPEGLHLFPCLCGQT